MKLQIGIRRQDKSVWERRTPMAPGHMAQILKENADIQFIVQPSKKRIFSDWEYQEAGAILNEDLSSCQLIIGVKEIPLEKFISDKTFMFFSHTIKAQPHNMPALDVILNKNIRLIDYEKITDQKNNRLIAFGKYAGIAGALDFLKGLGQYIMQMGISTPILNANSAYKYFNISDAYAHIKTIGDILKKKGIPKELRPMIFAITGRGRTAQGCLQVLQNLPVTFVKPNEIKELCENLDDPKHRQTIYVTNINSDDVMVPRDKDAIFNKKEYYQHPAKYKSTFKSKYLPYITALFHCIYWEPSCPVYIKNRHLKDLAEANKLRLLGICDISCDLDGSIQCLTQYTQPEKPFFYFDSLTNSKTLDQYYNYGKILYLAIDFLPCELAYDASMHFSKLLKGWLPNIVRSDASKKVEEQGLLPQLEKAVITSNGKLAPNFEYISKLREQNELQMNTMMKKKDEKKTQQGATASNLLDNVSLVTPKEIVPEKLDFTD